MGFGFSPRDQFRVRLKRDTSFELHFNQSFQAVVGTAEAAGDRDREKKKKERKKRDAVRR